MTDSLTLTDTIALFMVGAVVVLACGLKLTELADRLADRTGLGEAIAGGVFLGMSTSLAGAVVSFTAAHNGNASLAFTNCVGGIAAQTAFLVAADLLHRKANLEHASAEPAGLFQAALLLLMLSLPLLAISSPEFTVLSVHPVSIALVVFYVAGLRTAAIVHRRPMWRPVSTTDTRRDTPEERQSGLASSRGLAVQFLGLAALMSIAGYIIAQTGLRLTEVAGISATLVGALLTAVATSLPELVTTIAAVRRGALQLALGGIIGGNTFDVLFLSVADIGFREGSLYHAVALADIFWLAVGSCMTALLLLGLIVRERRGIAGIGFESLGIIVLYAGAVTAQMVFS